MSLKSFVLTIAVINMNTLANPGVGSFLPGFLNPNGFDAGSAMKYRPAKRDDLKLNALDELENYLKSKSSSDDIFFL